MMDVRINDDDDDDDDDDFFFNFLMKVQSRCRFKGYENGLRYELKG